METITNLANSASKAVWGDNTTAATNTTTDTTHNVHPGTETTLNETKGTEPVSGKLGDTTRGEPFDAGNMGTLLLQYRIASHHILKSTVILT